MAKRITMFVHNTVHNDNRVLKEARALVSAGYAVTVVGLQGEGLSEEEFYGGARVLRLVERGKTRAALLSRKEQSKNWARENVSAPVLEVVLDLVNRGAFGVLSRALWRLEPLVYLAEFERAVSRNADRLRADVWYAHDLNTLPVALSMRDRLGGKVVYDTHEYWLDCNNTYSPFAKVVWEGLEQYCIGKADRVVTVSESIAEQLVRDYAVEKPSVVLNSPSYNEPDGPDIRVRFGIRTPRIVVYVGLVTHKRGYEQLIEAVSGMTDTSALFLGPSRNEYTQELKKIARKAGAEDRIIFAGSVPPEQIQSAIHGADVGVSLGQPGALSYEMALPSKFFEYVFAGTPVLVSDFVELRRIVDDFDIGRCIDPTSSSAIRDGLNSVMGNTEAFSGADWEERRRRFIERYAWQSHQSVLVDLVGGLTSEPPPESMESRWSGERA